ncbi:MAG: hypothetical protein LBN07_00040 [Christensenellaceae bacterium]|jgi:hypothetical protein|nr:hypothetical protein [Christensenellaceae bacterium]
MKKTIGRFFMYLGIIIGVCITAVLVCGVVLMTVPNSNIFGVRYIKLDKSHEFAYDETNILNVDAIFIKTNRMSVSIEPNKINDKLIVSYKEGVSGFVDVNRAKVSYSAEVVQWSFNDNAGGAYNNVNTLMVVFEEPEGWVFPKQNAITLYVPEIMTPKLYSVQTQSGQIDFVGEVGGFAINETKLFMAKIEGGGSNVTINYPKFDRYILKTDSGTASFKNYAHTAGSVTTNSIDASIEFATNSGAFDVSNSRKNGTINGNVRIVSSSGVGGPRFKADIINGNLNVISKTGFVTVGQLGAEGSPVGMQVFSTNVTIDIKKVYGTILSLPMDSEEPKVKYTIEELTTPALSEIEAGKGEVTISKAVGNLIITTTSGGIKVGSAKGNVSANTVTGTIDITFEQTAPAYELNITTKEGEIKANNMRGKVTISVLGESGKDKKMTLRFINVVKGSTISGRGYDIDLISKVGSDIYMLVCSTSVTINPNTSHGLFSPVSLSDPDYVSGAHSYRVGYTIWDDPRVNDNIGKIVITKSTSKGNVTLSGEI